MRTVGLTIKAVALVLAVSAVLAVVGAIVWGALEWMRNYPASVHVVPDFFHTRTDYEPPPVTASTPLEALAMNIMNWYNMTFLGATRFGSGLGTIAGAFWSLSMVRSYPRLARLLAGLVGGAVIGSRLAQILGPFPKTFILATICGAALGALTMALTPDKDRIPPLPEDDPEVSHEPNTGGLPAAPTDSAV